MAGQNSRTVTLTLDTQTSGTDNVVKLASELEKLAKKGGEAAPEFQRLAGELDSIAKQQDAISAFKQTAEAVDKANKAMVDARAAAQGEGAALAGLELALNKTKAAEENHAVSVREAATALQSSKMGYLDARAAISAYLAEIGGAKSASREEAAALKEKQQVLRDAKAAYDGAKASVAALTPAYNSLKQASAAAAAELKSQERAFNGADAAAKEASAEYQALTDTLAKVSQAMTTLGVDATNVVAEQNRVTQSMAQLETRAKSMQAALTSTGTAATTTAQRIENAFGTVGVRSADSLRAEILRVQQAMMALARESGITDADFNRAFSSSKKKVAELEQQLKQAEGATKSVGSSLGGMFSQFGTASAVFSVVSAGINAISSAAAGIPKVTAEFQTMLRTLTVLTGNTTAAAKEFEYIKGVANRTGSDIKGMGDAYIRLAAATKDTALEGAQTKRVFEAVSGAMGMLGASSAETENALMAVSQMVSKGVVSMEEMRQQLGERLPGAFQVTAKELGITVADLNDLISSGKLAADDVLPAMARGLEQMYNTGAKNDTLIGKWREFTNAVKVSSAAVGDSGLLDSLLTVGRVGAGAIAHLTEGFIFFGKTVGVVAAGIKAGDLKGALAELSAEAEKMNSRVADISGGSSKTQKSISELAAEAKKAGQEFITLADGTKIATASVEGASNGFIEFLNKSAKATKSAEDFSTSARKVAEYTRSAGEASITAANALGSEIDKRRAAQQVAEDNAKALDALVVAEKKVLDTMEAEAMRRAEALRDGEASSDAHKKQLTELGDEIQKRHIAIQGLENQAEANRVLAQAREIESQTTKDNSARLVELKANYDLLAEASKAAQKAVADHTGTQQQANVVKNEAMKAERLYLDALEDSKAKIVANTNVKRAQLDLETAGINLAIQQQQTIYATARAYGDEYGANQALLKIKEYQIKLMQLTARMREAEAQSQLAQIEVDRAAAIAKGTMTSALEAELKARTLSAQAKAIEGKISAETAKQMQDLYDRTIAGGNAATGAAPGYDRLSGSLQGVGYSAAGASASVERLMSDLDRYEASRYSKPGSGIVRDENGNVELDRNGRIVTDTTSVLDRKFMQNRAAPVDIVSQMYQKGASIEEVKAAQKYYGELYQRAAATMLTGNLGNNANAAMMTNRASSQAMDKALELARVELLTGAQVDLGTSVSDLQAQALAKIQYGAGVDGIGEQAKAIKNAGNAANSQPVNITIGGKTKAVNMASSGDALALAGILKQLESDSARY